MSEPDEAASLDILLQWKESSETRSGDRFERLSPQEGPAAGGTCAFAMGRGADREPGDACAGPGAHPAEAPARPAEPPLKPADTSAEAAQPPATPADTPAEGAEPPAKPADTPAEAAEPPVKPAESQAGPAEPQAADESAEFFEWSADREKAIEEALRQSPRGSLPRVHLQLEEIRRALRARTITKERARLLVHEVEQYLGGLVEAEERKVQVAHAACATAREDRRNALYAWQEAAAATREFVDSDDVLHFDLAACAADQGAAFLERCRSVLLAAEPS